MRKKEMAIRLIRDDLINSKLVYSLGDIGLNADNYLLHLSGMVFELMGFDDNEQTDELTEQYIEMTKCIKAIDADEMHCELEQLAQEVYAELLKIKTGQVVLNSD
jgi:hypothetical protein